jgi:23S rRNA (cytosine1962-C5)-methyltransferase
MSTITLKPGKDKPVLNRHPWIFSGAIARMPSDAVDGQVVDVTDAKGRFLARGYLNRRSQITVRLLSWTEEEPIDGAFWRRRLQSSIDRRSSLLRPGETTGCRLVNAESDLLPGLIVDSYGDYLVLQSLTLGIERVKPELTSILAELVPCRGIYERSDVEVRKKEGLSQTTGILHGESPPSLVETWENGRRFLVDVRNGQKTGFYLDQRDNRARLTAYSAGRSVLNAFAYTGGFAVYAHAAGASSVTNVDTSADALALARRNVALNGLPDDLEEYVVGDVFSVLRQYRAEGRTFDLIVLDPPKFANSQSQVAAAARGYKDINWLSMQLLRPGGILFSLSCSGLVAPDLFQKILFGASIDARRDLQILCKLSQAVDHPILLNFPEGEYLKGLVCRVL